MTGIGFLLTIAAIVGIGAIAVAVLPMLFHVPAATTTVAKTVAKTVAAPAAAKP